jgi:hypothetical protein
MPQQPRPMPQQPRRADSSPYAPAEVLLGLIRQSENRYTTYRDLAMKQDRSFGQLQIDAQNLSIALSPHDPEAYDRIHAYLEAALGAGDHNKRLLEEAMQYEIMLQGELKRWLTGQPPSPLAPQVNPSGRLPYAQEWAQGQQPQGQPQPPSSHAVGGPGPHHTGGVMGQQQGQPPQGQPQQQGQPPQGQPQYFKGQTQQRFAPGDWRDPAQAAEVLRRAQEMPMGPGTQQTVPGQPVYVTPNAPGGFPPPPSGVPVQVQYADPAAAQQAPPPVHFPSAEAAAAAVAASHHSNTPINQQNGTPKNGA